MDKERIRRTAYQRMSRVEELFCDHVPPEYQQYWLLNFLIAEGRRSYIASYGLLKLDGGDCNDARHELGWGPLSDFERDCVNFWNQFVDQEESHYERGKSISLTRSVRTIGIAGT